MYLHACYFSPPSRALCYRIEIYKLALECVRDVMAGSSCAVKNARQIFTFFLNACIIFSGFRITSFIHRIRAVIEGN